jgi:subtilase family serine protease
MLFAFVAEAQPVPLGPPVPRDALGHVFHKAVCGLSVGRAMRCHAHIVTDRSGHAVVNAMLPAGTPAGYGPKDLRSAYNVAATGNVKTLVAIVAAYGSNNAEADLAAFRAQYGLPPCTTANGCFRKMNQEGLTGAYPAQDLGWAQEQALDLDMVSAMCPNCRIDLIEAKTNAFGDFAIAENIAATKGAHVISNSYGTLESTATMTYERSYNHPGVAITASTGDNGYGVQFPAASPHVIAVSGTTLKVSTTARGWRESVWSGAGSGCSKVYAKPSWQSDRSCAMRMVADVSADANPNTPVAVYGPASLTRSAWLLFGGTSAAAPLIAGIYGANGGAVTYGSNPYARTGALFDVTSGSNGSCGGAYLCTGKVGYDGPTGLGTPNGIAAF